MRAALYSWMENYQKHKRFFYLAQKLSYKSEYHHKIGAIVVKKNKIISVGFNKPHKTNPNSPNKYKNIHAEFDAIWSSEEDLKGASIYVFREHKNGQLASAKPCKDCQKLIEYSGIRRVYYTDEGIFTEARLENGG